MSDIEIRTLAAQPFAFIHAHTDIAHIGQTLMEILPEVWKHVTATVGAPTSPPMVRYTTMNEDGTIEMDGGVITASAVEPAGRIESGSLPAGEVATLVHVGPYETLGNSYTRLMEWLDANGRKQSGPYWEIYIDDPQQTPPEKLRTELTCPI